MLNQVEPHQEMPQLLMLIVFLTFVKLSRPMLMHFYLLMVTKLPISMSAIYNTDFMSVSIEIEMLTQTL